MFTWKFWRQVLERSVKTAAQAAILAIGADQINVMAVNWVGIAGFAAGGFVLSVLTSIVSLPVGEGNSPSVLSK